MARDEYVSKHTGAELDEAIESILEIKHKIPELEETISQIQAQVSINTQKSEEALLAAGHAKNTADHALDVAREAITNSVQAKDSVDSLRGEFYNVKHIVDRNHPHG